MLGYRSGQGSCQDPGEEHAWAATEPLQLLLQSTAAAAPHAKGPQGFLNQFLTPPCILATPLRGYRCDASPTCCTASLRQVRHGFLPSSSRLRNAGMCHKQPVGVTHRHLWTPALAPACPLRKGLGDQGKKKGLAFIPATKMCHPCLMCNHTGPVWTSKQDFQKNFRSKRGTANKT